MGGSSGGSSTNTTVQKADPWSGLQPHLKTLYSKAGQQVEQPRSYYPGQTYSPLNTIQHAGLQNQLGFATYGLPGQAANVMGSTEKLLDAANVGSNPYVQGMSEQMGRLAGRNLQENIMPSIRDNAIAAGQMGSTRHGIAEGIAARGAQESLDMANAQLLLDAYGQGLDAQTKAIGLAPSVSQMGMMPGQYQQQIGDVYRSEAQLPIDDAIARHNFAQNEEWDRLNQYNQLLQGGLGFGTTTSTGQSTQPGGSALGGALGGGLLGYGLGGAGMPLAAIGAWPAAIGGAILGGLFG